ncbi:hypothetical protein HELRODRAFT_90253 [Helobdella robusta]|uniref:Uncharacterized protein n=1 Tax=Helobdella robusta TaxID=6412 RepID=T1G7N4_HELRO|nr:hypothetical protein HELRODRAFT_90253 [Helobdella robusta]ESN91833.1 hypothetical protein HELRODRAFT_90253 [Helobdella robusta]
MPANPNCYGSFGQPSVNQNFVYVGNVEKDEDGSVELSTIYGPWTLEEDIFRRRLKYFFMNPYEKFQARSRIPWKMFIQILKIVIFTYQLIDFGSLRSLHIEFMETTNLALKHLYLKDWTTSYETMPYPPSMGKMACYTDQEFFQSVDFILNRYNETESIAIGNFSPAQENGTTPPVEMCVHKYKEGVIWAFNQTFIFDSRVIKDCFKVMPVFDPPSNLSVYNIEKFLESVNRTINFDSLIRITLHFNLNTVHLKSLHRSSDPDCFLLNVRILFDNSEHSGQMLLLLETYVNDVTCKGDVLFDQGVDISEVFSWIFNGIVLIICFVSSILCLRSFHRAIVLKKDTVKFFETNYPSVIEVTWSDKMDFVDMWYILIIINDLLTGAGCICKIFIQMKMNTNYEICGILLGTGSLFAWFGVLRYLAMFKSFNVLIVTLKRAALSVFQFFICAFFIFIAFSICGWIVLGPYHIKFRELTTSLECLYSLINGDDIYTTFATMNQVSTGVWLFSRLYLYMFISLFIYVVLSMFITIIADTYDSIKVYSYSESFHF